MNTIIKELSELGRRYGLGIIRYAEEATLMDEDGRLLTDTAIHLPRISVKS